jgi:hypothetical protein
MKRFLAALAACSIFFGCVSTSSQTKKAPDWLLNTPDPDSTYTYFVGDSSDSAGDQTKAEEQAVGVIISNIVKFMGVKIKAEFVGDTQATLDSYAASMRQKITESSQARMAGFTIMEKYASPSKDKKNKAVSVYVLAKYETKELNKERERIRKLIEEQENLVLVPEAAGNAALAAGRNIDAVQSFLQAASGAASVDIDNKEVKVERNLNAARNALLGLRLVRVSAPSVLSLGSEAPEPFVAKAVVGERDGAPGVPGAAVIVSYQKKQASGRLMGKSENAVTDPAGLVSFKPPAFDYVGPSKVSFSLGLSSAADLLDRIPKSYDAVKDSILREINSKYVDFDFKIESNAKNIAVQVSVLDIDENGAVQGALAQAGVLDGFLKEKFKASAANAAKSAVQSGDESAILAQAKALGAIRLLYGIAKIESVKKDGGSMVATCRISVSVLETASGSVLASSSKIVNSIGSTEAEARSNAFRDSGKTAIKDIISRL